MVNNAKFNEGDRVQYHPIGGPSGTSTSTGTIERVLDSPQAAGSSQNTVKASPDDIRYEIKNDNTGKSTAVKEMNIEKTI